MVFIPEKIKQNYAFFIQTNLPRVLTQIDRDPDSPTYGCCDRNYWHYKIRDFSSAILQQSGLVLAKLYRLDFPGDPLYQNQAAWNIAAATGPCRQGKRFTAKAVSLYFKNFAKAPKEMSSQIPSIKTIFLGVTLASPPRNMIGKRSTSFAP